MNSVVKGEMSAKTTYQKSAKGPVAIPDCAADGKYIILENSGRKVRQMFICGFGTNVHTLFRLLYPVVGWIPSRPVCLLVFESIRYLSTTAILICICVCVCVCVCAYRMRTWETGSSDESSTTRKSPILLSTLNTQWRLAQRQRFHIFMLFSIVIYY